MLGIFCTLEKNILRIHTHSNDQQKNELFNANNWGHFIV
ncbi:hypothetical protein BC059799_0830 [Bacillus cereus NVH0597-99]|nr:hypothetical protein BC059799_0830 [Bacillus cereus NVH0597-99]